MKKFFGIMLAASLAACVVIAPAANAQSEVVYRAMVSRGGYCGVIDENGVEIVPCDKYYHISGFDAPVTDAYSDDGDMGAAFLIDVNGNEIATFPNSNIGYPSEGLIPIGNNSSVEFAKFGYIDYSGNIVIPYNYDSANSFSDGLALVMKDGRYFYIDKTGAEVLSVDYELAGEFIDGIAVVGKDYEKYGFIDKTGKEVIPLIYDYAAGFCEGFSAVRNDGKWGFIDKTGSTVIPIEYDLVRDFSEGMAVVNKDGKCGYIDKTGAEVIAAAYDYAGNFNDGIACVCVDQKYGCIDKDGNVVVPIVYDYINDFQDGAAIVKKEGKQSFIDKTGKEIMPVEYDYVREFYCGFATVSADGKYGFINTDGELVVPMIYSSADDFAEIEVDAAAKPAELSVLYNNEPIEFDQPPIIENGRTLVPFRAICQAMGAEVSWDGDTQQVSAVLGDVELVFTINVPAVLVNGTEKSLDQAPIIKNGRTLLPARAFAEEFGARVGWDEATKTVIITK